VENSNCRYQSSLLEYRKADLLALEKQYKSAIEQHSRFIYQDTDWLDTSQLQNQQELKTQVLEQLANEMEHRQQINRLYSSRLPISIQVNSKFQLWRFSITVPEKQILLNRLFANGLFASSHYASLGGIFDDASQYPNAQYLHDRVINLFNDHHYSVEQAIETVNVVLEHIKEHKHEQ